MEQKVVGPLTFKQFIIISLGTFLSFIAYFSLGKTNMPLVLVFIAFIDVIACVMAFVKIGDAKSGIAENGQQAEKEIADPNRGQEK